MEIEAFGYIGICSKDIATWRDYATGMLGMQIADSSRSTLSLRMDDRKQRLVVNLGDGPAVAFFGWEVRDATALDGLAARLERAGVQVSRGSRALAAERFVQDLILFEDPLGNRLEAYYGPARAADDFIPSRAISGFRTGPLGLGHAVLNVEKIEDAMPFYQDILGFELTDYAQRPFRAYFFHVNARHHSLALIETGTNALHHVLMELYSLDDVGQGYDIAQHQDSVAVTLGRHINDHMTSFYTRTPSGFLVEYGWGGRVVDTNTWKPVELTRGYSFWGHERSWLSPEAREEARRLRMEAAAEGQRAPVEVLPGNHEVMSGVCPWWDATVKAKSR